MAKRMNNFSMLKYKDLHGVQVSNTAKMTVVGQCCISIYMANMLAYGSMHPNCVCIHLEFLCLSPVKVTPCPVFPDDAAKQDN